MQSAKIGKFYLIFATRKGIMMKVVYKWLVALLPALLSSIIMPAQEVPSLPSDKAVLSGVLPNGMSYYLVSNGAEKGQADFALVQKIGTGNCPDTSDMSFSKPRQLARTALTSLKRFGSISPQSFVIRKGSVPSVNGFVTVGADATVFRFENVMLDRGQSVADSTLLLLMDITDRITFADDPFLAKWYSPSDQAVIVSGDIDSRSFAEKLRMLSYMTPARPSEEKMQYVWEEKDVEFILRQGREGLSEISATWFSRRTPAHLMNTIHSTIFEMSVNSLGEIAADRLERGMKSAGIPVTDIAYRYISSTDSGSDESFTVSFITEEKHGKEALALFADVMSSIDEGTAKSCEYRLAEAKVVGHLVDECRPGTVSNSAYVDRCIDSFLYNSSLSSQNSKLDFYTSRQLPDTVGLRLFNDFASAFLDETRNLLVECSGIDGNLEDIFSEGWSRPDTSSCQTAAVRSQAILQDSKVRVRSVKKDFMSGGSILSFSNGVRVVYKKMDTGGRLYYNMALNGGYSSIPGLHPGEGAYMSDYPMLCLIAGIDAHDYMDSLKIGGMTMDFKVNMSNTMISGYLPDDNIPMLMQSLLDFTNTREAAPRDLSYYKACQELGLKVLEGSDIARKAVIDQIMCPGYIYSEYKMAGSLTDDFSTKAEAFFEEQTSKINDGVIVLVGDIDIEELKKTLIPYVAQFKTRKSAFRRPDVRYQPVSGWSTYTVDGDSNSVDVAMSTRMTVTVENYMASSIAADFLASSLSEALKDESVCFDISHDCSIYPEERFNVMISVSEISPEGFALGMMQNDPIRVLNKVRSVLSDLDAISVTNDRLNAYKASLKNELALKMKDPQYWTDAIAVRYLDGKDWTSNYSARIDAVTPDMVKQILTSLDNGCKVEYVTINNQ